MLTAGEGIAYSCDIEPPTLPEPAPMSGVATRAPIRVLIVDDHPIVRDGITTLLSRQDDMEVVGEACDGAEAVRSFAELSPDITLMDVQMEAMSGVEATRAIRTLAPAAKILMLTTYSGDVQASAAIRAGAAGYVLKSAIRKELLAAIRSVDAGKRVLSPEVAHNLAQHALDDPLTPRELDVLRLVAEGHGNKTIAIQLNLSIDTVKAHLKSTFSKLAVDDRTHAVVIASRRGYLDI